MFLDWRLGLIAQLVQSVGVGLLLSHAVLPQLAMLTPLVGASACLVLYWTGRRLSRELERRGRSGTWLGGSSDASTPMSLPLRVLTLLFWALGVSTLSARFVLPEVPVAFNVAAYWLVGMGLLAIILTRDPFKTGLGLMTFSNGCELIYLLFDPGLLVMGLVGIGTILTALAASYLTVARRAELLFQPEPAVAAPQSQAARPEPVETIYQAPPREVQVEEPLEEALVL